MTQPQPQAPTLNLTDLPGGGKRLALPGGGTVDFAHPNTISRGKHRRQIYGRVTNWDNPGLVGLDMMEAIAAALITAWDLPEFRDAATPPPLPRDEPGMLGELGGADYDAVLMYAQQVRTVIFPDTTGTAEVPTEPASA